MGYQNQPEHQAFAQLLQAPHDAAELIIRERFLVPRLVVCDQHGSQVCCPITAVQLEWSLWTRDVEEEIIPTCRELGIGIVDVEKLPDSDSRKILPKFQSENL
ncbi:unnamed protein product [Ilex paraguariensis]|uniref:Uncharacterized protein n=1 Tax=Ilex paraguariensis TaxID=185542 RepID=A0ABC8T741_9AQUA